MEVEAQLVTEEQPWRGRITSVFSDGSHREREVAGVTITSYLDMIQPHYSVIYQIKEQVVESTTSMEVVEEIVEETYEMLHNNETSGGTMSCISSLIATTMLGWLATIHRR